MLEMLTSETGSHLTFGEVSLLTNALPMTGMDAREPLVQVEIT
jgi:hypothetical protein